MIYVVTQDGLNNYPVEDEDIIKTIVTTIGGSCKYCVMIEQATAFNGKPCVTLGNYKKKETAVQAIKEIAARRSAFCEINGWVSCYFMPKEDEDVGEN